MAPVLNRDEAVTMNNVAQGGVLFPLLMQIPLAIVLIVPLLMLAPSKEIRDMLTVLTAVPLMLLIAWITGFFLVPKSLFKERRKGQLIPISAGTYKSYRWRWIGIFLLGNLLAFGALFAIEMAGVELPSSGLGVATSYATIYYANYSIAQRMLKNGDATINTKI